MSAVAKRKYLTPEEYLASERVAEYKSEYIDGVMYPLAGVNAQHSLLASAVLAQLNFQLKDAAYLVLNSDLKVRVPSRQQFHYPDVIVVCDEPHYADDEQDVLLNPLLLVEVLSKSTAGYDRRQKFLYYQELESFRAYLLIAQNEPLVQHHLKQPNGSWLVTRIAGLEQSVELTTINRRLRLKDIYAKVLA